MCDKSFDIGFELFSGSKQACAWFFYELSFEPLPLPSKLLPQKLRQMKFFFSRFSRSSNQHMCDEFSSIFRPPPPPNDDLFKCHHILWWVKGELKVNVGNSLICCLWESNNQHAYPYLTLEWGHRKREGGMRWKIVIRTNFFGFEHAEFESSMNFQIPSLSPFSSLSLRLTSNFFRVNVVEWGIISSVLESAEFKNQLISSSTPYNSDILTIKWP